jgi:hypothetical protein
MSGHQRSLRSGDAIHAHVAALLSTRRNFARQETACRFPQQSIAVRIGADSRSRQTRMKRNSQCIPSIDGLRNNFVLRNLQHRGKLWSHTVSSSYSVVVPSLIRCITAHVASKIQ